MVHNSTIFNALTSTAMPGSQVTFSFNPSTTSPVFPTILPAAPPPSPTVRPNVAFFDSNFQAPQIHQFDLILERDLGWGTVLKVSYLGSLGRELPNFGDINICTSAAQAGCAAAAPRTVTYQVLNGGPIKTSTLAETVYSGRPAGTLFATMTDIFSGVNSSYHA